MASSRSLNSALVRWLGRCTNPICILDNERIIRYVNAACLTWFEVSADEIVGLRCDYHSSDRSARIQRIAAGFCPPPEVLLGQRGSGRVACQKADDTLVYRIAQFVPLQDSEKLTFGVMILVETGESAASDTESAESHPDRARLHYRLQAIRHQLGTRYRTDRLIGDSAAMRRVRDQVQAAVDSNARVLVVGPRGSGCEHVARTIFFGPDGGDDSALLPVDCSLIDAELLQETITSLLAQCEASQDVRWGTLLLLGADQLGADAQHELLGFLSLPRVELRILATARESLIKLAENATFLPDLARTLSIIEINLPPLCERPEDIPLVCQAALEDCNARGEKQLSGFTDEALELLVAFRWPGNLDQLLALVGQAAAAADGPLITANDLPKTVRISVNAEMRAPVKSEAIVLDDLLADIEAELLKRAMARAKGNKTRAAELLSISRARLHRRLEQLDVEG